MKRKRILIAEDNQMNRDLLIQLLENQWDVIEAANGQEAIEMAQTQHPDLILMDLSMPVVSGWEATEKLKRKPNTRHIPVVAVSARTMHHEVSLAHRVGVDDFIPLPLNEERFFSAVNRHLGFSPTTTAPAP